MKRAEIVTLASMLLFLQLLPAQVQSPQNQQHQHSTLAFLSPQSQRRTARHSPQCPSQQLTRLSRLPSRLLPSPKPTMPRAVYQLSHFRQHLSRRRTLPRALHLPQLQRLRSQYQKPSLTGRHNHCLFIRLSSQHQVMHRLKQRTQALLRKADQHESCRVSLNCRRFLALAFHLLAKPLNRFWTEKHQQCNPPQRQSHRHSKCL